VIYEILGHGFLRLESEDSLYDFINKSIETDQEMFGLLEFVRFEYCSTDVMDDFFDLLSDHFSEINASMWATLRARLVLPSIAGQQFPPSVKRAQYFHFDVPDGIIAHWTRECGGNVHDRHLVDVTCGSFEKETLGANPRSGAFCNDPSYAAKNAADSLFCPAYPGNWQDIPHRRNNCVCYDFKERRIVPTHYTIRTYDGAPGGFHLKSWLVETSADGENWREVAREEDNGQLSGKWSRGTFAIAGGGECRFIRLVNIGRNHRGSGGLCISVWEIFGSLIE
jgi:hypothetical protein